MAWSSKNLTGIAFACSLAVLAGCSSGEQDPVMQELAPAAGIVVPQPAKVDVFATSSERTAKIVLVWSQVPSVRTSLDGRTLLLRFDRVFEAPLLKALPRRLADWIQTINATHDTILIRTALDVRIDVTVAGPEVTLDLSTQTPVPGETVIIGG